MLFSEAGVPVDSVSFCEAWSPGMIPASFLPVLALILHVCPVKVFPEVFPLGLGQHYIS